MYILGRKIEEEMKTKRRRDHISCLLRKEFGRCYTTLPLTTHWSELMATLCCKSGKCSLHSRELCVPNKSSVSQNSTSRRRGNIDMGTTSSHCQPPKGKGCKQNANCYSLMSEHIVTRTDTWQNWGPRGVIRRKFYKSQGREWNKCFPYI